MIPKSFLLAATAGLSLAHSALALKPGDNVTIDAISKAEKIQGELPTTWEPGKVYVLECWATWCGPCIAVIPHVDELYDKFHEKGLRVIGMNVWEDTKDKAEAFVKKQGDGMSYPVAFVGKNADFETSWLKAAGVNGIPHAFVVKDGKLLFTTHPGSLTEELITELLSGPEAVEKVSKKFREEAGQRAQFIEISKKFMNADREGDAAGMEAAIKEIEALEGGKSVAASWRLQMAVTKKDWAGTAEHLAKAKEDSSYPALVAHAASAAVEPDSGAPESLRKSLAADLSSTASSNPPFYLVLARLQWSLDQKNEAKQSAGKLTEILVKMKDEGKLVPVETVRGFQASLEKGELPSQDEFNKAARDEMKKLAAQKHAADQTED